MRIGFGKYAAILALGLCLGANGCAPSQVTHHSGQIGRFFGDGISFSVPVVRQSENIQQEDSFWEVRQGIGGVDVVVLGPFVKGRGEENFRENMVLTSQKLSVGTTVEQFREQQIAEYSGIHSGAGSFQTGNDKAGSFAIWERQDNGREVCCKAWFFVDGERSLGYVLLGTVLKDDKTESYFEDFASIASTFRIGTPLSGFGWLDEALGRSIAALGVAPAAEANAAPAAEANAAPAAEANH